MTARESESYGRVVLVLTTRELMSIDRMARAAGLSSRAEFIRSVLRGVITDEQQDQAAA